MPATLRDVIILLVAALATTSCAQDEELELTSPAFADGGTIPLEYSCEGDNVSPPLRWANVPEETTELALVAVDHDAPGGAFVHWAVWSLEPDLDGIGRDDLPEGARQAETSSGKVGWVGPCPPNGDSAHEYVFTLLALERAVDLGEGAEPDEAVRTLEDAAVASADLRGRFGR